MKVKAIAKGYYGGQIRNIGDVFDVPDAVSALWFTPVMPDGLKPEGEDSPDSRRDKKKSGLQAG